MTGVQTCALPISVQDILGPAPKPSPSEEDIETLLRRFGTRAALDVATRWRLPEPVVRLNRPQAEINDLIVQGALTSQMARLDEALELDPTVLDKAAGQQALRACIAAHPDVMPVFHESLT